MPDFIKPCPDDVLLVVDVQNDFCPGGALAVPDGDAVVPVINRLARGFGTVVLTQDWHPGNHQSFASRHEGKEPFDTATLPYGEQVLWPDHCVQGTVGAAFHDALEVDRAQLIIRKGFRPEIDSYSAFFENDGTTATGLAGALRERHIKRVVLVGLAFDFCVRWSAQDALKSGFDAIVIEDGTRGIDLDGSIGETRKLLGELGVPILRSEQVRIAA